MIGGLNTLPVQYKCWFSFMMFQGLLDLHQQVASAPSLQKEKRWGGISASFKSTLHASDFVLNQECGMFHVDMSKVLLL